MTEKNLPFYEQAYTGEQQRIAGEVIALEKDALDKYLAFLPRCKAPQDIYYRLSLQGRLLWLDRENT